MSPPVFVEFMLLNLKLSLSFSVEYCLSCFSLAIALSIFFDYAFGMFTFLFPVSLDFLVFIVPVDFYNVQYQCFVVGSVLLTFLVVCVVCLVLFDFDLSLVSNVTCVSELSILDLVLYACFVDRCLSFCTFTFGHCVVCSSSIYGF